MRLVVSARREAGGTMPDNRLRSRSASSEHGRKPARPSGDDVRPAVSQFDRTARGGLTAGIRS